MANCIVNNGRFMGMCGDVNVRGISGVTYPNVSALTTAERKREGIYEYIIKDVHPTYQKEVDGKLESTRVDPKYTKRISENQTVDAEAATYTVTRTYGLILKQNILDMMLDELKALRKEAQLKGVFYKGHRVPSDRNAQNDLTSIILRYQNNAYPEDHLYSYKVANGVYILLNGRGEQPVTKGIDGIIDFSLVIGDYIEKECFGKEGKLAMAWSLLAAEELVKIDISGSYVPDPYLGNAPE